MIEIEPKKGWMINPNSKIVIGILKGLERNNGECPCHNNSIDKKCPCSDYRDNDECHCNLYIKE